MTVLNAFLPPEGSPDPLPPAPGAGNGALEKITVQVVRTLPELATYRDAWNRLAFQSHQQLPVLSWAWVASFVEHCIPAGESWACLMALGGSGRLLGVLPVRIQPHRWFPWLRQLNSLFESAEFLVAHEAEEAALAMLVAALGKAVPGWFSLKLARVPASSPALSLARQCPPGVRVIPQQNGMGSMLKTEGAFEAYLASLDKKHTRNIKRFVHKVQSLPGANTRVAAGPEAASGEHLERFLQLEASGWKGRSGTAILNSPAVTAFYRDLARRLAECGWLEWHFLETGDKIMAGQLAVRLGNRLLLYKIAYDEAFSEYAPGLVLRFNTLESAFKSEDTTEVDFLSDMPDHLKWRMQQCAYYKLSLFPRRFFSTLAGYAALRLKLALRGESTRFPAGRDSEPL